MTGPDPGMVSIPENVLIQRVHTGEAVILNLDDESYFGLNEVGVRMMDMLVSSETLDAAVESLASEYEVEPAVLRRDMAELVETLRSRGLIDVT